MHNPLRLPRKTTSERPKGIRTPPVSYTFDFEMCFAPQRRALFRHLNFQKWSEHNGVQFFISHLTTWLRTRGFSESTFRPSGATNHWKNRAFRDFPTFSRTCIFCLLTLSLFWYLLSSSLLFSDTSQLCFSSVHIVGSLTSKLPSIKYHYLNLRLVQKKVYNASFDTLFVKSSAIWGAP